MLWAEKVRLMSLLHEKKKKHFLVFYASVSSIVCEASTQKALEMKTNFIPQLFISV